MNVKPLKPRRPRREQEGFSCHGTIQHIDVTQNAGILPVVEAMQHMAFTARDLHRAADIYDRMLRDRRAA